MRAVAPALSALLTATVLVLALASAGAAHTESDVVAVPAGSRATVTLEPTHGCGASPTVEVSIRAPAAGATAGPVDGWSATATPDGPGHTVLAWTGGVLPADATGSFPVTFTAPDTPGQLLTFPAVQVCEDGEELAWISGDPDDDFPAPRVLVLPAAARPAATVDDVPADAPGRDQLTEIVDVDGAGAGEPPAPTASGPGTTPSSVPVTTDGGAAPGGDPPPAPEADADDGSRAPAFVISGIGIVIAGYLAFRVARQRSGR